MLLAVIADTHLPGRGRGLPDACVERIRESDLVLHAGDFVAENFLDELESLGPPVAAVHGNIDEADLRRRLPAERTVEAGEVRIGLVHDAGPRPGRLPRLARRFPEVDAVIFGHSHIPLHDDADGLQIFNPGSPTDRRREPRHTMGLAHVRGGAVRFEHVVLD